MLPIKDTIRSRSFPYINWLLILINSLIFLYQINLTPTQLDVFIYRFALVPENINLAKPITWYSFITHIFLHGGWLHIISNMWVLYIFGDNVEDRLGSLRYLIFYLLGGISAGVLQYIFSIDASIPALGASGAIAAIMGAYLLFFPHSRVITFIPIFFFGWFVEIPSIVFLGIWFLTQLFSGLMALSTPSNMHMGGIAWWAHVGGFLFGLLLAYIFTIGYRGRREYRDEYYPW